MSEWDEHDLETKIVAILSSFQYEPPHHFGRPFVSSYQIALAFAERYETTYKALGRPIGGAGRGSDKKSLVQYITKELSDRIKDGRLSQIEGAWFDRAYVEDIRFKEASGVISASNQAALSLFRLTID